MKKAFICTKTFVKRKEQTAFCLVAYNPSKKCVSDLVLLPDLSVGLELRLSTKKLLVVFIALLFHHTLLPLFHQCIIFACIGEFKSFHLKFEITSYLAMYKLHY